MQEKSIEETAEEIEREVFLKWLNRICGYVRSNLLQDQETDSYSLQVDIPSNNDNNIKYEVKITARRTDGKNFSADK